MRDERLRGEVKDDLTGAAATLAAALSDSGRQDEIDR